MVEGMDEGLTRLRTFKDDKIHSINAKMVHGIVATAIFYLYLQDCSLTGAERK